MKKHLIIGSPIDHSLSPKIHNYWFKENKIDAIYEKNEPQLKEIKDIFEKIKEEKIFGMNVTVPFKQLVIPFIDVLSPQAKKTNSVNTVCKKKGKIYGDNTDIVGFELALKDSKISLANKSALIIGAGGVVPSIIVALENLGIRKIHLSNRTKKKIENIKLSFPFVDYVDWGNIENYDLVINATSVGLKKNDELEIDISNIKSKKFFYDVIYNPSETNFLKDAKTHGHRTMNGESMFLYQAQKAFEIWHNISPKIDLNLIKFFRND